MSEGPLPPDRAALVQVSAALSARDPEVVRRSMEGAAAVARHEDVEEVILQSYLFLGYPAALNGFDVWRAFSRVPPAATEDDAELWRARGQEVCRAVYGGQYPRLRENIRNLHPDMERWMVEEGYGKVLGRPALPMRDRELCISALLAVLQVPRQLYAHLRGALNVGATSGDVEHALRIAAEVSTPEARGQALDTWRSVRERVPPRS